MRRVKGFFLVWLRVWRTSRGVGRWRLLHRWATTTKVWHIYSHGKHFIS